MKLDIGCLDQDFKKKDYIGIDDGSMDRDETKPDVFANAYVLPFKDNVFDEVFSSNCIGSFVGVGALNEVVRVLKEDGVFELWISQRFFDRVEERLRELGFVEVDRKEKDWDDDDPDYRLKFELNR